MSRMTNLNNNSSVVGFKKYIYIYFLMMLFKNFFLISPSHLMFWGFCLLNLVGFLEMLSRYWLAIDLQKTRK